MNQLEILLKLRNETKAGFDQLEKSVGDVKKQTEALSGTQTTGASAMGKYSASATAAAGVLGALAVAATAAGAAIGESVREFAKAGSELSDLKNQLGIGVVEIQKLQFAAKQSGTDFGSLTTALIQMEKAASKTPEKFEQLGISFGTLRTSKPEELLGLISDRLHGVSDANERARIATELFGRGGSQILKLLMDDYRGLAREAEKTGLMTEEMAARGDRLDDSLSKLDDVFKKLKINIGAAFAQPGVISAIEKISDAVGMLARNADKAYLAFKMFGGGAGLVLQGLETMGGSGGVKSSSIASGGVGQFALGKGFTDVQKAFEGLDKALAKLGTRIERDGIKAAERMEKAEERLFAQRSKGLASSATPIGGFGLWTYPEKYGINDLPAGDPRKVYNFWGDSSKFGPMQLDGNIHVSAEKFASAQARAAESAARWAGALQGVALMAGAIGGKIGQTAGVMENIARSFEHWDTLSKTGKFNAVAGAAGQIGGLVGGTAGAGIQGAAGGAMTGFALGGPVGAAIGGVAGGLLGIFGASSAASKAAKAELASLQTQLTGLADAAKKFGIDIARALNSGSATEMKNTISAINQLMEDQRKRLEGLSMAAGGLNAFVGGGAITDQASSDRAGLYATAIFGNMVKETGDIAGALAAISPALSEMSKKAEELGLTLAAGVSNLIGMNNVLSNDEGLSKQLSGLNQMMKGLADANLLNKDLFAALGTDATAVFNKLIEGGASGNQALALMQPTLQQLYEGQKRHGWAVDEATQKLLDQAEAEGIVGDQFMSANERIVELLAILVETLGGTLPDALKRMGDAAEHEFGRMGSAAGRVQIPYGAGTQTTDRLDGYAKGSDGLRDYGRETPVVLHGREAVLTEQQYTSLTTGAGQSAAIETQQVLSAVQSSIASLTQAVEKIGQSQGAIAISPQVSIAVDAGSTRRNQQDLLANVEQSVADGIRRGTSPVLAELRRRGFRASGGA